MVVEKPTADYLPILDLPAKDAFATPEYRRPRTISKSIAPLLQELEMLDPGVVTKAAMRDVIDEVDSHLTVRTAIDRLVRTGWLLPLRTRNAWEYVNAGEGGRDWSLDPWTELQALLANEPDAPVAMSFYPAVWESGHAMHPPTLFTFAHRPGWRPPKSLSDYLHVGYDWKLPCVIRQKLPTWQEATIVVAIAALPLHCTAWDECSTWLADTFEAATKEDIMIEAEGRSNATLARLGFLAEWLGHYPIANMIRPMLPEKLPVTYLGRRRRGGNWRKKWGVYDTLLPLNPVLPY